eukprot:Phypoly_transcript_03135.p1 GENE.Phypoly_transcript_03135~~Phypoly_transcript_03135.p1  ORF type:complete len:786 (+),score=197.39 Phypoly_transcript_03135:146-2503(+)
MMCGISLLLSSFDGWRYRLCSRESLYRPSSLSLSLSFPSTPWEMSVRDRSVSFSGGKKGDLEVTIVEARNVNCKGHAVYCTAELKSEKNLTPTKPAFTSTAKDCKWNSTVSLDLLSYDGEELIIKLFYKRTTKKDKFLGQSQMKIAALSLTKEPEWHFLTDKPEELRKQRGPGDLKRSRSITQAVMKRKDKFVVTGEILFKLNFVHRLIKAKSKIIGGTGSTIVHEQPAPSPTSPTSFSSSRLMSSPSVSARLATMKNDANGKSEDSPYGHEHAQDHEPVPDADLSMTEEVIIDEALKEKQRLVREKLETGERIVRNMSARIAQIEKTEGEEAARGEKAKLEQIKKEIKELEKILETTQNEVPISVGLSRFFNSANPRDARKSVRYSVALNNGARSSMGLARPPTLNLKQPPLQSAMRKPSFSSGSSYHIPPTKPIPKTPEKFDNPAEELRYLRMKVTLLEQNNSLLLQEVQRLDRDLHRYQREEDLNQREAKLREREERLLNLGMKSPRRAPSSPRGQEGSEDGAEMDGSEDDDWLRGEDEKYDMIVAKLEKLDKLDELLRKLDSMKMGIHVGGGMGDGGDGRGYAELKAELEALQAIIMDETNKYTQKQKEEANINYEKVSQEYQQTPEYKKEVAAALEERRRKNEPLNKAALEKMIRVYTPEAIRDNPDIKERVKQNPELTLIGMDPKIILAKHQNDFQQYMLRNLTMDELRAVRASLPKFRNDQKRQTDWVETLENKIETVAKSPPKPPTKKAPAIKIKTKPPGEGGDFLSELMKKRKQIN